MITYYPLDPLCGINCIMCNHIVYDLDKRQYKCAKLGHWIEHDNKCRPNDCTEFDTAFHTDFKRILHDNKKFDRFFDSTSKGGER